MIGQQIGNYKIASQIGVGGMGTVYLAQHTLIGKRVAIKILRAGLDEEQADDRRRFLLEAEATSRFRHPGVIEIFDCGFLPSGQPYLVMELLTGLSLARFLTAAGARPVEELALVGSQIADALGAAHEAHLVHRDLKPDNVFLVDGRLDRLKILDFGISKVVSGERAGLQTRPGTILGTPSYMAPEQCRAAAEIDHRADVYALGCILYEMAAGQRPFRGEGIIELISAHLMETPAPLSQVVPGIPAALDALVAAMLGKSPEDRPSSMAAVAAALLPFAASPRPAASRSAPAQATVELVATATGLPATGEEKDTRGHTQQLGGGTVSLPEAGGALPGVPRPRELTQTTLAEAAGSPASSARGPGARPEPARAESRWRGPLAGAAAALAVVAAIAYGRSRQTTRPEPPTPATTAMAATARGEAHAAREEAAPPKTIPKTNPETAPKLETAQGEDTAPPKAEHEAPKPIERLRPTHARAETKKAARPEPKPSLRPARADEGRGTLASRDETGTSLTDAKPAEPAADTSAHLARRDELVAAAADVMRTAPHVDPEAFVALEEATRRFQTSLASAHELPPMAGDLPWWSPFLRESEQFLTMAKRRVQSVRIATADVGSGYPERFMRASLGQLTSEYASFSSSARLVKSGKR